MIHLFLRQPQFFEGQVAEQLPVVERACVDDGIEVMGCPDGGSVGRGRVIPEPGLRLFPGGEGQAGRHGRGVEALEIVFEFTCLAPSLDEVQCGPGRLERVGLLRGGGMTLHLVEQRQGALDEIWVHEGTQSSRETGVPLQLATSTTGAKMTTPAPAERVTKATPAMTMK